MGTTMSTKAWRYVPMLTLPLLAAGAAGLGGCGSKSSSGGKSHDAGTDAPKTSDGGTKNDGGGGGQDSGATTDGGASDSSIGQDSATASETGTPGDSSVEGDTGMAGDAGCVPPGVDAGELSPNVLEQHKNATRDGVYVDPSFSQTAATGLHLDATFTGKVTGTIFAQPLWVEDGPNGAEAFIVATTSNHVTALGATGSVIWDKTFGTPATGGLSCGSINPLGVLGTPYVDATARTIYFDAMIEGPAHMAYAISLDDGSTKQGWPININNAVTSFDSAIQNERGALQLLNGVLYIPYSGLNGDCADKKTGEDYHGWVVGIPVATPGTGIQTWSTSANKGGIWGPGSLPSDGTYVYPVTGNTSGANNTWGGGEAVLRLSAGPAFSNNATDYYAPSNWQDLDNSDTDLGGANDVLLDMPCTPYPHLVAAFGKDSNLYLLNRDNLGGIGMELSKTPIATDQLKGSPVAYHTAMGTYVASYVRSGSGINCPNGRSGNLVVALISPASPPTATVVWCSVEQGLASPIVTTTDGYSSVIVWDASNRLYGYDGDTGNELYTGGGSTDQMSSGIQAFSTIIETKSRIAVPGDGQLFLFQ